MLVWALSAAAEEGLDTQKTALDEVNTDIKNVQKSVTQLAGQKNSLEGRLAELERRYSDLSKYVNQQEQQAAVLQKRLRDMASKQKQLKQSMAKQGQVLSGQIRSAYAMGREEKLKLILNQADPAKVSRIWTYYGYFNRARLSRLKQYQTDYKQLQALESETSQASTQLAEVLDRKRAEQAELSSNRQARKAVLAKLGKQIKTKEARLNQLQRDQKRLQDLIIALQSKPVIMPEAAVPDEKPDSVEGQPAAKIIRKALPVAGLATPFHKQRGHLFWPVKGKVLQTFGSKRAPGRWDGLVIEAREGVPVRAVSRGRVAFSDWLRGYGLLTIIDHGNGYMTLYAFNQSLNKSVGDWVNAGDVIASVGDSGGRPQTGLYFEVRKKGKPVNPLKWLRKA